MARDVLVNQLGEAIGTTKEYYFSFKEMATELIRAKGIHEGHWSIEMALNFSVNNLDLVKMGEHVPFGMITITKISLQRHDEPTGRSVDAAEVNPFEQMMQ